MTIHQAIHQMDQGIKMVSNSGHLGERVYYCDPQLGEKYRFVLRDSHGKLDTSHSFTADFSPLEVLSGNWEEYQDITSIKIEVDVQFDKEFCGKNCPFVSYSDRNGDCSLFKRFVYCKDKTNSKLRCQSCIDRFGGV